MENIEERIEIRAVRFAEDYYRKQGWNVVNVSRARGEHAGYDLYLSRGLESLKVEVKGCSRLYQIPDLYSSEIDPATMQLIADELCVVYYIPGILQPQMAIIAREHILPEHVVPKAGYRISGRFKNQKTIEPLMVKLSDGLLDMEQEHG